MSECKLPRWRAVAATILLILISVTIALNWRIAVEQSTQPPTRPAQIPAPHKLKSLQLLGRADLITAAKLAASAYVESRTADQSVMDLAGRRFELALPFGCNGSASLDDELIEGWRFIAETAILEIAFPSNFSKFPTSQSAQGELAAVEYPFTKSFWIKRDWLQQPVCPKSSDATSRVVEPENPWLAIAEPTRQDVPRSGQRRGAPYRLSKRLPVEEAPDSQGLRLILTGRLTVGEGGPVLCKSISPDRRPICVILARFESVSVTDSARSSIYGEWFN